MTYSKNLWQQILTGYIKMNNVKIEYLVFPNSNLIDSFKRHNLSEYVIYEWLK